MCGLITRFLLSLTNHSLVIGAGVSGLSVAWALLQRGVRVTLLERGETGAESSWAGGGILSPLLPWDYSEAVSALALRSMATYADWVKAIEAQSGQVAEYWPCGMRVLDTPRPEDALAWCATHGLAAQSRETLVYSSHRRKPVSSWLVSLDSGFRRNDESRINQRIPRDTHTSDLWLPGIAQVRNPRLVAALREAVVRLGGVIHTHCQIEDAAIQTGRVLSLLTNQGSFSADRFVLATGAWSGIGLPGLAGTPNILPVRGQMLLFKLEPGVLESILYRKGLYLIPRRDGHVLAGSTLEDAGFDKSTDIATLQRLHAEATELLPVLGSIQPIRHWAGLRPGSPDNIPVIGRHPDLENVFVNTGHYRYGVTMAPASAELLVDLMEDKSPVLDPAPYSWQAALERAWGDTL
jgi:glycine oxidase